MNWERFRTIIIISNMLVKNSKGVTKCCDKLPKNFGWPKMSWENPWRCVFWTYFEELNPNMKSVCPRKYLIMRYQSCRVCLSATVPISSDMLRCVEEEGLPRLNTISGLSVGRTKSLVVSEYAELGISVYTTCHDVDQHDIRNPDS